MASTQVNPTRMELTRLKKKLATATRGHKLLKDKRDELMRQFLDLVRENMALRQKVEAGIRSANVNFVIAKAGMSEQALNTALAAPKQAVYLEADKKNVMSVDIPVFHYKTRTADENDIYSYGFAFTSSDLDGAVKSLADILPDMLRLSETEKACQLMAAEIEKTRRRVNALEHVIIPEARKNIKYITMKLDENERSTQIRLMKVKDMMLEKGIQGSFGMGGITGYMVDMLEAGCFKALLDVQCFDLKAVESIRSNPKHMEVSATQYSGVSGKSAGVDSLDVVLLGATQVDLDFNVNVHTDSNGYIMGGSGGHCDTAAGAKLAIIIAPLTRARLPLVVDRCLCISTPGKTVDVVVTQRGIAVNTEGGKNVELKEKLKEAKLPVVEIADLKRMAEEIAGVPKPVQMGDKVVANVIYRDGTLLDVIHSVK